MMKMARMTDNLEGETGDGEIEGPSIDRVVYQIEESKAGSGQYPTWSAHCPDLLIVAFGDTAEEARDALRQQVAEYLEDCDNLGALDEALIEAGLYYEPETEIWISSAVKPVEGPDIVIL